MSKQNYVSTDSKARRKAIGKVLLKIVIGLAIAFIAGYIVFCFKQG